MAKLGRILIVDVEETFLHSTADLLRKEGYECDCVLDAKTAVEILRKTRYDLLIAVIKIPGNSDLEVIKELPQIAAGLPVILVTDNPPLNSAIQSIQPLVVAYLLKPFELNDLLVQVKDAMRIKGSSEPDV